MSRRLSKQVNQWVDRALPSTRRIAAEALPEKKVYRNGPLEPSTVENPLDLKPIYPIHEHVRDFTEGIRALFITNSVWFGLNFASFLILIIWRWFVTDKILPVSLTTVFSIFNSDPTNHPDQFYPVVWGIGSYPMDALFLAVFAVAFIFPIIKLLSIWYTNGLISDRNNLLTKGPYHIVLEPGYLNPGTGEVIQKRETAKIAGYTSTFIFFNEDTYHAKQKRNFYISGVIRGQFWVRWLEWFLDGGLLLWAIMTSSVIQETFQLFTLIFLYGVLMILGYIHEHINQVKLTNVDLLQPFVKNGEEIIINRKPKKWYAFALGLLANAWIWVVVFTYYGYGYIYEESAKNFQWFRLTIAPIGLFFYLLFIPLVVLVWSLYNPTYYKDIKLFYPQNRSSKDPNPEPVVDKELQDFFGKSNLTDPYLRFSMLPDHLKDKVAKYMAYQDWNKNCIYEIVMMSAAGICKHLIIWILWGGMLSQ